MSCAAAHVVSPYSPEPDVNCWQQSQTRLSELQSMQGANCDSVAKHSETGTQLRGARNALGLLGALGRLPLWLWHHKRIRIPLFVGLKHTDSAPQPMQDLNWEITCRGGVCPAPISGLCNLMTVRSTLALTVHFVFKMQPLLLIDLPW